MKHYITRVEFHNAEREVWVYLSNGGCVKIYKCYESWAQYNATVDEKFVTVDLADIVNGWLHGDNVEPLERINKEIVKVATEWIRDNEEDVFDGIEDFDVRRELAMSRMDRFRSPLKSVDSSLYDEMHDKLSEWCEENGFDVDKFDIEDMAF